MANTDQIRTKVVIDGESDGIIRAVDQTRASLEKLRDDQAGRLGRIEGFEQAQADLEDLQKSLDEARRKLSYFREQAKLGGATGAKTFAADIRAAERDIDRLNAGIKRQNAALRTSSSDLAKDGIDTRNLGREKERLASSMAKAERGIINLKGRLQEERAAAQQAAERTREAGNAADHAGKQGEKSAGGFSRLAGAMKALAAAAVVKEFLQANAGMESMQKSLEMITGSSVAAGAEMEFIRAVSGRLGLSVDAATNSYIQLAASAQGTALEGAATRDIWTAVAEAMARLGKSTADTDGALLAISQMMSKGVVSAEELRGQLGERLPGAFQVAARAMGVTTQELGKMLQSGEVIAADFLPRFAAELRKTGGDGGEINTFTANLNRLWNSLKTGAVVVGQETGVFALASGTLKFFSVIIEQSANGVGYLSEMLRGNTEEAKKFSDRIRGVGNDLGGMGDAATSSGVGVRNLGSDFAATANGIERAVQDRITASVLRLGDSVKDTTEALKKLGMDPEQVRTGISTAEREIIDSAKRVMADRNVADAYKLEALLRAVDQVSNQSLPELDFAWKTVMTESGKETGLLEAGLNAVKTKTAGLWKDMEEGARKAADETEKLNKSLLKQADELDARSRAPVDDSPESQAGATLDLTLQKMKLERLSSTGGTSLEDIRAQAEAVRQLAGAIKDAEVAQTAKNYADQVEARALRQTTTAPAADGIPAAASANDKIIDFYQASAAEAVARLAMVRDELNKIPSRKTVEVDVVLNTDEVSLMVQRELSKLLSTEALKRGSRL